MSPVKFKESPFAKPAKIIRASHPFPDDPVEAAAEPGIRCREQSRNQVDARIVTKCKLRSSLSTNSSQIQERKKTSDATDRDAAGEYRGVRIHHCSARRRKQHDHRRSRSLSGREALRLRALPVVRLSHLTPAKKRALAIADNKLAELGDWDLEILSEELSFLYDAERRTRLRPAHHRFPDRGGRPDHRRWRQARTRRPGR